MSTQQQPTSSSEKVKNKEIHIQSGKNISDGKKMNPTETQTDDDRMDEKDPTASPKKFDRSDEKSTSDRLARSGDSQNGTSTNSN